MKVLNKKIIISFMALLLLAIASFSILTFMFADENSDDSKNLIFANVTDDSMTMIDWIIENSHSTDPDIDPVYHILEIYSGNTPSDLQTIVEGNEKIFEELVLNGHKSNNQSKVMAADKISYVSMNMKTDDATLKAAIELADFIYMSEDPDYPWTSTNDISNTIKDALAKHIATDLKPIIFDSHNLTQQYNVSTETTVKDMAENNYNKDGLSYATYKWPHNVGISDFMNPADVSATYIALDGDTQKANTWVRVALQNGATPTVVGTATDADPQEIIVPDDDTEYIARVLTIKNSNENNDTILTDQFKDSCGAAYDFTDRITDPANFDTTQDIRVLTGGSDVYKFAYKGRKSKPTAICFEEVDIATNANDLKTIDFADYDFVILELSTKPYVIGSDQDLYNAFVGIMYSGVHLLYDGDIAPGNGGNNGGYSELTADCVKYCYDKAATSNDTPRYPSVLVSARKIISVRYAQASDARDVNDIANIINNGNYRGLNSNSGGSSTTYTVLEIEPCYPINLTLANYLNSVKTMTYRSTNQNFLSVADRNELINGQYQNSFYYIKTDAVEWNRTTDEIDYGAPGTNARKSLTTMLEDGTIGNYITSDNVNNVVDYYNWHLSEAKIKHATGRDNVNIVHMSSTEFACSRKTLLDNYDAIYIGGDNSAIKDGANWYINKLGGNYYTTYYHNGDVYDYETAFNDSGAGTYGVFSGNDITVDKLEELKDYASKMPVIIEKGLCDKYANAVANGENQHDIDPASNMYKFLTNVLDVSNGTVTSKRTDTVLANFDNETTVKVDNTSRDYDSKYGQTIENFATVFAGTATEDYKGNTAPTPNGAGELELNQLLQKARPLLYVYSFPGGPDGYTEDPSSWITPDWITNSSSKGLTWKVKVTQNATINLYIDDDGNGRFTSNEIFATKSGKDVELNFKPQADFYGLVYWKIEAKVGNLSSSYTNRCKVKRTTQSKIYINLLQIMPGRDKQYSYNDSNEVTLRTLFLCTECQFAKSKLVGNRYTSLGMYYAGIMGGQNTFYNGNTGYLNNYSTDGVVNKIKAFDTSYNYTYNGTNLGSHTHDFGIVKYDTTIPTGQNGETGMDDVASNWFEVIKDDYDVDTTILYTNEFENKIKEVKDFYNGKTEAEVDELINGGNGFGVQATNYHNYYLAMQALINSTDNDNYYNGKMESNDSSMTKYVDWNNGYAINTTQLNLSFPASPSFTSAMTSAGFSTTDLNNFAQASYQLEAYLTANRAQFHSDLDGKATDDQLDEVINGIVNSDLPRDKRKYYDLYNNYNASGKSSLTGYSAIYRYWRDAKIIENYFFERYQNALWYAAYDYDLNTVDLEKVYGCICLGAAETFNNDDLNEAACDSLLKYIDDNGNLILFHDALTSDSSGTTIMSQKLSSAFGMNPRHVVTSFDQNNKEITLYFGDSANEIQWSGTTHYVTIPCSASSVTISYNDSGWGTYSTEPTITNVVNAANPTASHNITITLNGNQGQAIGLNAKDSFLNNGNAYANGSSFTVSSDNGVAKMVVGSEDPIKFPTTTYFISNIKGTNNDGISLNYRMLSMKGKYVRYDKGGFGDAARNQTLMYKYASFHSKAEEVSNNNTRIGTKHMRNIIAAGNQAASLPTDKAKQNNVGIITMYPFPIAESLQVGATCSGSYAVDVEDKDLIVYYSLVGGTVGTSSSLYAADPMDGVNNYFLYQYGNITYTGAGHGLLTGYGRENNDERRLFINCIVNAGRRSVRGPGVKIYDYQCTQDQVDAGTANKIIKEFGGTDCDYIYEIEDLTDFVGFNYIAYLTDANNFKSIEIYYDVDHTTDGEDGAYECGTGDKMIYTNANQGGNVLKQLDSSETDGGLRYHDDGVTPNLKLEEDCFDAQTNRQYAYIVVHVVDSNDQPATAILRIQYKTDLIDLD